MLACQVVVYDLFKMDSSIDANMSTKGFQEVRAGPGFLLAEYEPLKPHEVPIHGSMPM